MLSTAFKAAKHPFKSLSVLLVVGFLLNLNWPTQPKDWLEVSQSHIASGHYAIVKHSPNSGDTLFFGSTDGKSLRAIKSSGDLFDPFIVNPSQMLVVEYDYESEREFRLLEIKFDGNSISCNQLITSLRLIGSPIVPRGARSNEVWFFSGEINPNDSGTPSKFLQLSVIRDGKVAFLRGPSFRRIGRLAQVGDERFLLPAASIASATNELTKLSNGTSLADIRVDGEKLEAKPVAPLRNLMGNVAQVSSQPEADDIFVLSHNFIGEVLYYVSRISLSGEFPDETISLPAGRRYSGFFLNSIVGGASNYSTMYVDSITGGADGRITISDFYNWKLINDRQVEVLRSEDSKTSSCKPGGAEF